MGLPRRGNPAFSLSRKSTFNHNPFKEAHQSCSNSNEKGPLGLNTLYDPPEPAAADLVFVHGLGGGSRSTWTHRGEPSLYWPQEWLPEDATFHSVRIHSFGYDSNWGRKSILSVYDFAKSLILALWACPLMPKSLQVCHSLKTR